jgi:hypothetical protein
MAETMDDVLLAAGDKMIDKAGEAKNFICFSAHVHDGKVSLDMTSWEFPPEDFLTVAALIVNALKEEQQKRANKGTPEQLPESQALKLLLKKQLENHAMPEPDLQVVAEGANETVAK